MDQVGSKLTRIAERVEDLPDYTGNPCDYLGLELAGFDSNKNGKIITGTFTGPEINRDFEVDQYNPRADDQFLSLVDKILGENNAYLVGFWTKKSLFRKLVRIGGVLVSRKDPEGEEGLQTFFRLESDDGTGFIAP